MNGTFLRIAVGFVVAALLALSISLYLSTRYLEEQERLSDTGDMEGATQSAEMAARLNPFSAEPLTEKASLLQSEGRDQDAERVLQAAADREPASYEIMEELGALRMDSMNKPLEAAESYKRAVELNPLSAEARSGLATAYLSAGKLKKAKVQYEKIEENSGLSVDQMYDLGRIYVRTGEPEEGVRILRKAQRQAERELQGLTGPLEQSQQEFIQSVELATADALVVERRYARASKMVAASEAAQAQTILSLINSNPEGYRRTVLNSDVY